MNFKADEEWTEVVRFPDGAVAEERTVPHAERPCAEYITWVERDGGGWLECLKCGWASFRCEPYIPISGCCARCKRAYEAMPDSEWDVCGDCFSERCASSDAFLVDRRDRTQLR